MNEKSKIFIGVVALLAFMTFPFLYNLAVSGSKARPELEMPVGETKCIETKEYMNANHMNLLNQWRDAVVRQDQKEYTSQAYHTVHEMSLTRECLRCHTNRANFCDRCHTYADVQPYCWSCHVEPKGVASDGQQ